MEKRDRSSGGGGQLIASLPDCVLLDILARLDLESLCSAAPVCRALRSLVSRSLASITSLDLSGFSPSAQILIRVLSHNKILRRLTLDCSQLDDSSVEIFSKAHLEELVLLKCSLFSSYIFTAIGEKCPNLRLLKLEMVFLEETEPHYACRGALAQMLMGCSYLESLCIKFQHENPFCYESLQILSKSIRALVLQPVSNHQAKMLILGIGADRNSNVPSTAAVISCLRPTALGLQSLSLVLHQITDELLISITDNLHCLAELCLEDKPKGDASLVGDLTHSGLQSLGSCRNLTRLSITRSKQFIPATFRLVNDLGILLLAEACEGLEFVRLGGFSRVTDAGFISILHSCKNLKRVEIVNAFLSDLAFHDLADAPSSLVEVRLVSCNLLTSESVVSLSLCRGLEVLDLSGCKSIADAGLNSISKLCKLTTLDLGGADITDSGLSALGRGSSPIASLCLRGCKRVTDRGVDLLLRGDGVISRTLSNLDLGYLSRVSDRAITTVAEACREITSLCIRHCFSLTDASMEALGSLGGYERSGRPLLRRLDIYNCCGLSIRSLVLLARPRFRGLRWLGAGGTRLLAKGGDGLTELSGDRPGLSICASGCEMGCKDGWHFHLHSSNHSCN